MRPAGFRRASAPIRGARAVSIGALVSMGELRLPSVSDVSMVHEHDWTGPTIPATSEADAMHALFVLRADQFEGLHRGFAGGSGGPPI